ncbi:MAG: GNAT family N-acetyltransferase [Gemmatimonadota bacterium]
MTRSITDPSLALRLAHLDDLPAIEELISASARGLSLGYYTPLQIDSLVQHAFAADRQLIADGTYYVCPIDGELAAVGGWSRRRTLHGGDRTGDAGELPLDPATDAARIRAFFVHPAHARRGLGRALLTRCMAEAAAAGFRRLTLVATLPGEPLYRAAGFLVRRRFVLELPDGVTAEVSEMEREIGGAPPPFRRYIPLP